MMNVLNWWNETYEVFAAWMTQDGTSEAWALMLYAMVSGIAVALVFSGIYEAVRFVAKMVRQRRIERMMRTQVKRHW